MIKLKLPWPPSVNEYWHHTRTGQTYVSPVGRAYRETVAWLVVSKRVTRIDRPAFIKIIAYPPDNRRRDLDNLLKAVLDGLQHGGAITDDRFFDHIEIMRESAVAPGWLAVTLGVIGDPEKDEAHPQEKQ